MGTWGSGPFENDDAQDFLGDLAEAPADDRPDQILAALDLPDDYVEIDQAAAAVAAAALIAAANGMPAPEDAEIEALLASGAIPYDVDTRQQALAALARVNADDSEWRDLWREGEGDMPKEAVASLALIQQYLE